MPQIEVSEGRHLTADEYVNGRLVRVGKLVFAGEQATVSATEATELVKDTKRFKDKGKS